MRSRSTSNVGPTRPAPAGKPAAPAKTAAPAAKAVPAAAKPAAAAKPVAATKPTKGRVKLLTRGQGSGIISAARGDVFFHKSDFQGKFFDLNVGDEVSFDLLDDSISGPRAQNVRAVGAKKAK